MKNPKITLAMVMNHMQRMEGRIVDRIEKFEKDAQQQFASVDRRLAITNAGIDEIDSRLDTIEISIVEQQHEHLISRLERHAGFIK